MGMTPDFLAIRPQTAEQDFAGVVVSVPSEDSQFKSGDRVWGIIQGPHAQGQGALSEYIAVDEERIALIPSTCGGSKSSLTMDEASGLATVGISAVQVLETLRPDPKWHVFVVGGEVESGLCECFWRFTEFGL